MSKNPSITVIMPCCNNEQSIYSAIESILGQSFSDFELIIIDDASNDNALIEIQKFTDSRIRSFRTAKNQGIYSACNLGLKLARGKYVSIMEADNISMPDRLKVQFDYMENHPKVGCIGSAAELIDKNGKSSILLRPNTYPLIKVLLIKNNCFIHSSLMLKRSFLKKNNLTYNTRLKYSADYDLMVRCARHFPIRNLDEVLVKYFQEQVHVHKNEERTIFIDSIRRDQLEQFQIKPTRPNLKLHLKLMRDEYLTDDDFINAIKWLNKILDRNEQLNLLNPKSLYDLFYNTLKFSKSVSQLGGWAVEEELIAFIHQNLPPGKTILEFGSGSGTDVLLKKYNVVSIEHNQKYAYKHADNHTCIYSPLKDNWYDSDSVKNALKHYKYDMILVDGPPGETRQGILKNLALFKDIDIPIIFDDMDRRIDKQVMIDFCDVLKYNYHKHQGKSKEFAYCTKS